MSLRKNVDQCFIFFDKSYKKYNHFLDISYKHCMLLIYNKSTKSITMCSLDSVGLVVVTNICSDFNKYIKKLLDLDTVTAGVRIELHSPFKPGKKPFPIQINTCNEIVRLISGVNVGFTITPKHLHDKLLNNNDPNYEIVELMYKNYF